MWNNKNPSNEQVDAEDEIGYKASEHARQGLPKQLPKSKHHQQVYHFYYDTEKADMKEHEQSHWGKGE